MFSGNAPPLLVYFPLLGLILISQTLYFALAMRRGLIRADVPAADVHGAHRRNLFALAFFSLSCIPAAGRRGADCLRPVWRAAVVGGQRHWPCPCDQGGPWRIAPDPDLSGRCSSAQTIFGMSDIFTPIHTQYGVRYKLPVGSNLAGVRVDPLKVMAGRKVLFNGPRHA